MKNIWLLLGTLALLGAAMVGISLFFSAPAQEKPINQSILNRSIRHAKGQDNARVTIVEFSDFQCPACKAAAPIVKQVMEKYPNDVKLVYRNFPLYSIHPYAERAAMAAEVASESGKFWEFHDLLFTSQEEWVASKDQGALDTWFADKAASLGVDKRIFQERMSAQEIKDRVTQDATDGNLVGVDATPTFFVNGKRQPAPNLLPAVEAALAQK